MFNGRMDALDKAINAAGGTQVALAKKMGSSQTRVSEWYRRGQVAGEAVLDLCRAVDYAVTPHEVRPDLYPHPDDGLPPELRSQVAA